MLSINAAALAAIVPLVAAHGFVSQIKDGSVVSEGTSPQWFYNQAVDTSGIGWKADNQDNGFVADPTSTDIACHKNATAGRLNATVKAGDTIDVTWNTWPTSHKGPVLNYLAPVTDFASSTAGSLSFFKFQEVGYSNGTWGADAINQGDNFTSTVTIPSSIKAGNYVLRHEIIALHSAGSAGGAQFYPQCLQLIVTGGGSVAPAGEPATSFYKATDPGILIDIYNDLTNYTIPGPAIPASLGGSTASTASTDSPAPAAAAPAAAATTSAATTTAAAAATTSAAATASGSDSGSDSGSTGSSSSVPATGSSGSDSGSDSGATSGSTGSTGTAPSGTDGSTPSGTDGSAPASGRPHSTGRPGHFPGFDGGREGRRNGTDAGHKHRKGRPGRRPRPTGAVGRAFLA